MFYPAKEGKLVQSLHGYYRQERLRILIGDEIGAESGLRVGRDLYGQMVGQRLKALLVARNPDLALVPAEQLEALRAQCVSVWQADALDVLEKASEGLGGPSRAQLTTSALFRDTPPDQLQASAIHKQLAVMRKAHLTSLSLDPLLERAAAQLGLARPRVTYLCGQAGGPEIEPPLVLETLIGGSSGAARDLALKLRTGFAKGPTLLVGFAPDDRVLRWVLSHRTGGPNAAVCAALLVKPKDAGASWAVERMLEYFGAQPIWVDSLVEVEPVLRNILYGVPKDGQAPAWVTGSIRWRHKEKGLADDVLYSEGWQAAAAAALRSLVDQLDFCFAAKSEEGLDATLLVPMRFEELGLRLSIIGSSRADVKDPRASARRFCLHVAFAQEQGMSGLAFSTGMILNSADEPSEVGPELNFDEETRARWYEAGFRQWRSILSIPVLDSGDWLPIAVVAITSNLAEPFWLRLSDGHREEMLGVVRRTAKFLLNEAAGLEQLASHVATELRKTSEPSDRSEIAEDVLQDVLQTMKPRPLVSFSGYLCTASAKLRMPKDSEYPIEVRVCRTQPKAKHSVRVQIGERAEAARVDFEVSVMGEGFEFAPESAGLTIEAEEDAASATFRCVGQPRKAGSYEFYIQLYQSARFVEVLTCEAEVG